ncbi:MAG: 2-oxoacid:acceptor oxidoreductase subunit alpha [Waddliaceae bacterium]
MTETEKKKNFNTITIQACGGAGDGSLATGALIARSLVKMGYHVLIHDTFPAEIRGFGKTLSDVRISTKEVTAKSDKADILIGLNNPFSIEQLNEVSDEGIIIHDSKPGITIKESESIPHHAGNQMKCCGIPLENTAQKTTGKKLGKNVVAVGFLAKLLRLKPDLFIEVLKELFTRKGEKVLQNNINLFMSGYEFEETDYEKITLAEPANQKEEYKITSGNDAMTIGAIRAGLTFYAGYPITPASKLMENLAVELPKYGGITIQTEDEISAVGAVAGAWFAGKRALTATSGPGLSLMTEIINLGVMSETPLVVVNVMRGGPSTGLPTKVEQSDLNLALYGGHGDSPRVVLAPATIGESYSIIQDALDIAEKYQTPVIVLSDKFLAMSYMDVPSSQLQGTRESTRIKNEGSPEEYRRYQITPSGISPWAIPGEMECPYTETGLEHNEMGAPSYDSHNHHEMTNKRFRKFKTMLEDLPKPEFLGDENALNLILTWGSTFGVILEATERLKKEGFKFRLVKMKTLFPQHEEIIREALKGVKRVIIPEQNKSAQFARMMKGYYGIPAEEVQLPGGAPVRPGEVGKLLKDRLVK